eukprot:1158625-Pelagomonas_calceolata.AAC.4
MLRPLGAYCGNIIVEVKGTECCGLWVHIVGTELLWSKALNAAPYGCTRPRPSHDDFYGFEVL